MAIPVAVAIEGVEVIMRLIDRIMAVRAAHAAAAAGTMSEAEALAKIRAIGASIQSADDLIAQGEAEGHPV